ncbi:MAG TPA: hypothetical protein VGE56_00735 [Rhodocyclaceae bacterium]
MGLLDQFAGLGNLSEDQTQGLLAAAAQMLQASGPSRTPAGFGQIAGAGIGAYSAGSQASKQRRFEEEQARQMAAMRGLQMQGLQGELMDAETARNTPKAIKYSTDVKVANGPDGKPVMYVMGENGVPRIVDGLAPREAAKIMPLGGKNIAYNEFEVKPGQEFNLTQTPDSIASNALTRRGQNITMRGQNMTDDRARDFNAVSGQANALKLSEKQETAKMTKASQVASFDTMLGTIERLGAHPGLPRSVGLYSKVPTIPGSDSANFQAELETFQSQAFIPMVAQLKGMGALSDAEGKKLTAAVGALNPNMSEKAFKESLGRVMADMEAARSRVAGPQAPSPAEPKPAGGKVATMADIAETARKSGKSTAEVTAALRAKGYTIGGK